MNNLAEEDQPLLRPAKSHRKVRFPSVTVIPSPRNNEHFKELSTNSIRKGEGALAHQSPFKSTQVNKQTKIANTRY